MSVIVCVCVSSVNEHVCVCVYVHVSACEPVSGRVRVSGRVCVSECMARVAGRFTGFL